jgi:cytochrome c-type biogenesis protein CcmH
MMRAILFLLVWLPFAAFAQTAQPTTADPVANKRAVELAEVLRCLVCQNQSIAESNAELAVDLRRQIREQIEAGKSDKEITAYMVDRYGDFVLYRPPVKGMTLLLWFGPVLLLLIGLFVLFRFLRERGGKVDQRPLTNDEQREADLLLGDSKGGKK